MSSVIAGEKQIRPPPKQKPEPAITDTAAIGRSSPLGATIARGGVNFSLYSRAATGVELLFFNHEDDGTPSRVFSFDPVRNHTYHYWHVFVPGIRPGQIYGYRVHGPAPPDRGLRYDSEKVLLDPYGRGVVVPKAYDRDTASRAGDNAATAMKSVVVDPSTYDWQGDAPLHLPSAQAIIYEMHVRGFTRRPNSGIAECKRGTYAGLIEKIPYLQQLGISAVELLPIFQFDALDCPPGKVNYWGYAPISFFAPHQAYSSRRDPLGPVDEFRDMVKALHRAGIEVILDVVYNHTAEGNENGPMLCFRGIDNPTYYILEEGGARYANYTGCGNTVNANQPVVRRMIVDSLRYWVEEMHVDGFRFDLASILSRDASGHPLPNPPVLWDIESDPVLANTKLLAEAWDAAGLYQVGSFVGDAWKEWNGRFRDDVRDFFRGEPGSLRRVADRIVGSPEVYGHKQREAEQSVNFVTCHDGFTLNDLVSYNQKHNEANGEDNRDGAGDNRSWNCGVEGPTDDPAIERLRNRQVKNFLTITMMSLGVPMILMGDEVRHTQHGNNNAYCHDNELTWFDWSLVEKHADVHRFVSLLSARRSMRDAEHERRRTSLNTMLREARQAWHGVKLNQPDWSDNSHSVALGGELRNEGLSFYLVFNAYWEPIEFDLPKLQTGVWRRWIDTALVSPQDIVPWEMAPEVTGDKYRVAERSVVMLYNEAIATDTTRSSHRP
jgi:glycogen operon protein